jgi:hypothetical protein
VCAIKELLSSKVTLSRDNNIFLKINLEGTLQVSISASVE